MPTAVERIARIFGGKSSSNAVGAAVSDGKTGTADGTKAKAPASPVAGVGSTAVSGGSSNITQRLAAATAESIRNRSTNLNMDEAYRSAEATYNSVIAIKADSYRSAESLEAVIKTLERDLTLLKIFLGKNPRATYLATVIAMVERKISECKMVRAIRFPDLSPAGGDDDDGTTTIVIT